MPTQLVLPFERIIKPARICLHCQGACPPGEACPACVVGRQGDLIVSPMLCRVGRAKVKHQVGHPQRLFR